MPATYPLDTTGLNPACLVTDELHTLTEVNANPYRLIVPTFAPFYLDHLELEHIDSLGQVTPLVEGVHYGLCLIYLAASRSIGKMLHGAISINTNFPNGTINLKRYQTLGGSWTSDPNYVLASIAAQVYNPRVTAWDNVTNVQSIFPPINHDQNLDYVFGYQDLITAIQGIVTQIAAGPNQSLPFVRHLMDVQPASHVGLGNVQNIATAADAEVTQSQPIDKHVTLRQLLQILLPNTVSGLQNDMVALNAALVTLNQNQTSTAGILSSHVSSSAAHTPTQVGLGNVVNLSLATDAEVTAKTPSEKYITLRQAIMLFNTMSADEIDMPTARYISNR